MFINLQDIDSIYIFRSKINSLL